MQNRKRLRCADAVPCRHLLYITLALFTACTQGATFCPKGYYSWRKKLCLKVTKQFDTWENAASACADDGGFLAAVHSASEMSFIRVLMMSGRAKDAYIGLSLEAKSEVFVNADGSEPNYFNWRNARTPTKSYRQCAVVSSRHKFKWLLTTCNRQLRYVCKYTPDPSELPKPLRHRCYVCEGALSNEECNRSGMKRCQVNELSCQNEVRVQDGVKRIYKRCKQPRACENNYIQNPRAAWYPSQCSPSFRANSVCRCCCQGDLCNDSELPCLEDSSCEALTVPQNALITCTNEYRSGSECTFRCEQGYRLVGDSSRRCNGVMRSWTSSSPTCEKIACPLQRTSMNNGKMTCTNENNYGSTCSFRCNNNYALRGRTSVSCLAAGRWSAVFPTCQIIRCPEILQLDNGTVSRSGSPVIGSFRSFSCVESHHLQGADTLRCVDADADGRGEWDKPLPSCQLIVCPEALAPSNGSIVMSSAPIYDSVLAYSCDEGHFLVGNAVARCVDANNDGVGEWDYPIPQCREILCPEVVAPEDGRFANAKRLVYGAELDVICNEGYYLVGEEKLSCHDQDNNGIGEWDHALPRCEVIRCPDIAAPSNGGVDLPSALTWGSSARFSCEVGYFLQGSSVLQCVESDTYGVGEWNAARPTCQLIHCPELAPPSNGTFKQALETSFNSTVDVVCEEGFFLVGVAGIVCLDPDNDGQGTWSDELPQCRQIVCQELPNPPFNGFVSDISNNPVYGSVATFSCDEGYFMVGSFESTCQDLDGNGEGDWSETNAVCQRITCLELTSPTNGSISITDLFHYGSLVTADCDEGYHLSGDEVLLCQDADENGEGDWNGTLATCDPITCENTMTSPDDGGVFCTEENFYGSACFFNCAPGFHLNGSSSIECVDSDGNGVGEWTDAAPTCDQILCLPEHESPSNGSVSCSDGNKFDSNCHFSCNLGYFLSGQDLVRCLDENVDGVGEWSDSPPVCEQVTCVQRNSPEHGSVSCSDGPSYGSQCTFTCDVGFSLVGFDSVQCGEPVSGPSGRWDSEAEPRCQINTCDRASANPTNGSVQCSNENKYNSLCVYTCATGYRMVGPQSRSCLASGVWSDPEPKCEIIRCKPSPTNPDDGVVFCTEEDKYGSVCNYFCDLGFRLVGEGRSECTDDLDEDGFGTFDATPGFCEAIYCPPIEGIREGGTVICGIGAGNEEPHRYGSECALVCFDGYRAQGASRTDCLGGGQWTDEIGVCERYKCFPPLLTPDQVSKSCSNDDDEIGTVCRFQCSASLSLRGSTEITCLDSGEWSDIAPTCGR